MAELEQNSICSEETNSLYDEDRIRKLFQACDSDGDGYIDSQDLLTVCRELNLEDSLEELMKELGADENGRISYKEFLCRRLALRPEIDALRSTPHHSRETVTPDYLPTSSDNSLGGASGGKCCESWEFDSGARDLSPEPNTLQRLVEAAGCSLTATNTANLLQLANKLHLAALASLRGEILDLTSRLHTVTHERDMLERAVVQAENSVAQQYEEQLTELHSVIAELSRKMDRHRTLVITEEEDIPSESEQSVESSSQADATFAAEESTIHQLPENEEQLKKEGKRPNPNDICDLRAENMSLQEQLSKTESALNQNQSLLSSIRLERDNLLEKLKESQVSTILPPNHDPVPKIAERVRLRKVDRHITGSDLTLLGVSRTEIAEQLVSELQDECDMQELSKCDRRQLELETECLTARLEHVRSQVSVLQLSLDETKNHCERLCLLVGKYESNITATHLALNLSDRVIEAYDLLLSLLDKHSVTERCAEEDKIRKLIADLKAERNLVRNTVVKLESLVEHPPPQIPFTNSQTRKLDLETAVLMQELMAMREDKSELRARIYLLEKERENQELKVATLQSQQQAHLATIQHLQVLLQDHAVEEEDLENHEVKLRDRLKEVSCTLERVSRNAEMRQRQAAELATELKTANSVLLQSLERCKRKSQSRLRRLETQMLAMVERHATQVRTLKQRIAVLEESQEQETRQQQTFTTSQTAL